MAKKKVIEPVKIRKIRVNYELRFNYLPVLTTFIKTLPREHRQVRVDNVLDVNGGTRDEWVRIIREVQMGNIISFLVDNSIPFVFENLLPEELNKLRQEYLDRQKRVKEALKLKEADLTFDDMDFSFMKIEPYDYQKQAVKFFEINQGKAILGDQPGVGKTLPPITYAAKHGLRTLVICPASLKLNWRKEILKFSNEKAHVYKYNPTKKSGNINYSKEDSLFHIINYESIQTYIKLEYKHKCKGRVVVPGKGSQQCGMEIIDLTKKHKKCPDCKNSNSFTTRVNGLAFLSDKGGAYIDPDDYDLIVIDEFHRIKSVKTDWTRIIKKAFRDTVDKKILISGTAIKSRPMEFFSGLNFLDANTWNSSHDFGLRYCAAYETNFGWDYSGASNLEELFVRISPYFLRRLKSEVLSQLPPKTYTEIEIELTPSQRTQYNKLVKEMKKVLNEDGTEEEKEESYLEKIHKLKQFTGEVKMKRMIDDGVVDDIASNGEKLVVMSDYQNIAESLNKEYKDSSVLHTGSMGLEDKQTSVERFQEDKNVNLFCGMIGASGVGITLTEASKLIFLGFAWTPADMEQAEDRIHRATTTHDNIHIIQYIVVDTIDEDINALLKDKSQVVSKVLDNKDYKKEVSVSNESIFKSLIERLR
jgi:SWI/SNF-related matrix-associated actin-dependent regulator 1 of chromatin subfamily A